MKKDIWFACLLIFFLAGCNSHKQGDSNFNIINFGAKSDGSLATKAIQSAIDAANKAGGDTVTVPKGTFISKMVLPYFWRKERPYWAVHF